MADTAKPRTLESRIDRLQRELKEAEELAATKAAATFEKNKVELDRLYAQRDKLDERIDKLEDALGANDETPETDTPGVLDDEV